MKKKTVATRKLQPYIIMPIKTKPTSKKSFGSASFFCFYSNSDVTELGGNFFATDVFPLELTAVLKIYREENLPKLFKIAKNGILKNRIGENAVFSRFDGVFQKYEFHIVPWSEMPSVGFW